jgi:hypothetical protein
MLTSIGVGMAVGGSGVAEGTPHPTKSKKNNVSPIICCSNFWQLIFVLLSLRQCIAQSGVYQPNGGNWLVF